MFFFLLHCCIYVAPWSCEARRFIPLYVPTCSGMTIKLNSTCLEKFRIINKKFRSVNENSGSAFVSTDQRMKEEKTVAKHAVYIKNEVKDFFLCNFFVCLFQRHFILFQFIF